MAVAPPPHVIYWRGSTYKSLQSLVASISSDEYALSHSDWNVGIMAVYFANAPAIDLAPVAERVLRSLADTHPNFIGYYQLDAAQKAELNAWRTQLRSTLKAEFEALVPIEYAR